MVEVVQLCRKCSKEAAPYYIKEVLVAKCEAIYLMASAEWQDKNEWQEWQVGLFYSCAVGSACAEHVLNNT